VEQLPGALFADPQGRADRPERLRRGSLNSQVAADDELQPIGQLLQRCQRRFRFQPRPRPLVGRVVRHGQVIERVAVVVVPHNAHFPAALQFLLDEPRDGRLDGEPRERSRSAALGVVVARQLQQRDGRFLKQVIRVESVQPGFPPRRLGEKSSRSLHQFARR
jgi:hypothetical protein